MSAHKLPIVLTRRAQEDFEDILLYSQRRWGEAQRQAYGLAIDRALQVLGDNPNIGRARDDLPLNYRSYLVEQHVILYRVTTRAVSVSRIIHNRMDTRRALQSKR